MRERIRDSCFRVSKREFIFPSSCPSCCRLCSQLTCHVMYWGAKGTRGPEGNKQSHNTSERNVKKRFATSQWVSSFSAKHKRPLCLQQHSAAPPHTPQYYWPRFSLMASWIWDKAFHLFSDAVLELLVPVICSFRCGRWPCKNNSCEALRTSRFPLPVLLSQSVFAWTLIQDHWQGYSKKTSSEPGRWGWTNSASYLYQPAKAFQRAG